MVLMYAGVTCRLPCTRPIRDGVGRRLSARDERLCRSVPTFLHRTSLGRLGAALAALAPMSAASWTNSLNVSMFFFTTSPCGRMKTTRCTASPRYRRRLGKRCGPSSALIRAATFDAMLWGGRSRRGRGLALADFVTDGRPRPFLGDVVGKRDEADWRRWSRALPGSATAGVGGEAARARAPEAGQGNGRRLPADMRGTFREGHERGKGLHVPLHDGRRNARVVGDEKTTLARTPSTQRRQK